MTDIQQARDALAEWRSGPMYEAILSGRTLVPIIDGTAGNPELLDAIDGLLELAAEWAKADGIESVPRWMYRIAAAIIAADERMSA